MSKPLNFHTLYFQDMQEIQDFVKDACYQETDEVVYYSSSALLMKTQPHADTYFDLVIGQDPQGATV